MSRFYDLSLKYNNRKKVILFSTLILVSITVIFINEIHKNKISKIESYDNRFTKVKIATGSQVILSNEKESQANVESDKKRIGANLDNSVKKNNPISNKNDIIYENKNTVQLKTEDTAIPNNVEKIDTKVIEDTMLINFEKPKDNGTSYSYLIKNDKKNTKEKNYNFYSESGIKGYCYEINNNDENVVKSEVNKLDESPFVIQQINWNKNYYLHIKTIDNNLNESNCNTIKLILPSKGLRIRYIDLNTNNELCNEYRIDGNANDEYDISDKIKNINGYKLITKNGNTNGKLKKEQINIEALYAKSKNLTIKYIDEETKSEIKNSEKLDCYVGQKVDINIPTIIGYKCKSENIKYVVNDSENVVKVYYEKIKIPKSDANIKSEANIESKKNQTVKGENTNKENGGEKVQQEKILQNRNIKIKYVDFDTNKVLFEETKILKPNEKKIKIKMYHLEGYSTMSNKKDESNSFPKEENKTIMDELKECISGKENSENLIANIPSKQEYEILMNCDQSDYIIYYKKQ